MGKHSITLMQRTKICNHSVQGDEYDDTHNQVLPPLPLLFLLIIIGKLHTQPIVLHPRSHPPLRTYKGIRRQLRSSSLPLFALF